MPLTESQLFHHSRETKEQLTESEKKIEIECNADLFIDAPESNPAQGDSSSDEEEHCLSSHQRTAK